MGRWVVAVRAGEAAVSATEPRYVCIDQKCKKLGPPGLQHVGLGTRIKVDDMGLEPSNTVHAAPVIPQGQEYRMKT